MFEQTAALGRQLCANRRVDVISLSGTWHSVMLLDKSMNPVTPVYQWPYTGAEGLCAELQRDAAFTDWFYRRTGCMVSAIYPAFKLMHLTRQGYDLAWHYATGQGTYNFYRLTGQFAETACMASGTGFLNTHTRNYDDEVLEFVGVRRESLPRLAGFGDVQPLSRAGAAALGLPYAFASHFAPAAMTEALALYHRDFKPSKRLRAPYAMLALNVVAADTRAEAQRLFTTQQQSFVRLRRGMPGLIPPPIDDIEAFWTPQEKAMVEQALACSVVGDARDVREGIAEFAARHRPDELMLTANIFDHQARLYSFELAARAFRRD